MFANGTTQFSNNLYFVSNKLYNTFFEKKSIKERLLGVVSETVFVVHSIPQHTLDCVLYTSNTVTIVYGLSSSSVIELVTVFVYL